VDQSPLAPGDTVLRGVPKGVVSPSGAGTVSEVLLEVTPSDQIVRIVLMDADGGARSSDCPVEGERRDERQFVQVHASGGSGDSGRRAGP